MRIYDESLRFDVAPARQSDTLTSGGGVANQRVNCWLEVNHEQVAKTVWNNIIRHAEAAHTGRLAARCDAPDRTSAFIGNVHIAQRINSRANRPHNTRS